MWSQARIILPSEHGSWSLALTPFLTGAGVAAALAPPVGGVPLALCLLAALALFLARQPLSLWVRARRGKAKRADGPPARGWSLLLLGVAGLAGGGMVALGRGAILWLAVPAAAVLGITLAMSALLGPRRPATELVGAAGLALAAPAAYVATCGRLDAGAWLVWAIATTHNAISVLYVRLRIDHRHERASVMQAAVMVGAHALALIAALAAALWSIIPPLVALPAALLLVRAIGVAVQQPLVTDVRRFGFVEMGLALAFAGLVIAAFALAH